MNVELTKEQTKELQQLAFERYSQAIKGLPLDKLRSEIIKDFIQCLEGDLISDHIDWDKIAKAVTDNIIQQIKGK